MRTEDFKIPKVEYPFIPFNQFSTQMTQLSMGILDIQPKLGGVVKIRFYFARKTVNFVFE